MAEVVWRDIYGLYKEPWGDRIVPEAYAHPAKVAPALARRIVRHGIEQGWWVRGETVLVDPFYGIGGFGLAAGWMGVQVIGIELEPDFVRLAKGYECPGVTKRAWVRFFARGQQAALNMLCPACKLLKYKGRGRIPHHAPHHYVGNHELHAHLWALEDCARPIVVQGDSRELRRHIARALASRGSGGCPEMAAGVSASRSVAGALCSPPYANTDRDGRRPNMMANLQRKLEAGELTGREYVRIAKAGAVNPHADAAQADYGSTPGNLGNMPMGSLTSPAYGNALTRGGDRPDTPNTERMKEMGGRMLYGQTPGQLGEMPMGSVASPPYAGSLQNPGGGRLEDGFGAGRSTPGRSCGPNSQLAQTSYGSTPGQLGALRAGSVSSPPYEEGGGHRGDTNRDIARGKGIYIPADDYGESTGQLGNERGQTFWSALRVIATELYELLPAGSVSAWVVADFVRNRERVPFCDDCATLLEQMGFTVFERWRTWKVSRDQQQDMFTGETERVTSHLGFFRRLSIEKGSPEVANEEVLWFAKEAPNGEV